MKLQGEYWRSHLEGPPLKTLNKRCHDCAVDFYHEYVVELQKEAPEVQKEVVKRWYCHNHANCSCKGVNEEILTALDR